MNNPLSYDKFIRCECCLPPLLSLPLNRTPTYTYPPTPFRTLFFLLNGIVSSCLHTKNSVQESICLQVLGRYETRSAANTQSTANTQISAAVPRFLLLCQHHLLTIRKLIQPIKMRKRQEEEILVTRYCSESKFNNTVRK